MEESLPIDLLAASRGFELLSLGSYRRLASYNTLGLGHSDIRGHKSYMTRCHMLWRLVTISTSKEPELHTQSYDNHDQSKAQFLSKILPAIPTPRPSAGNLSNTNDGAIMLSTVSHVLFAFTLVLTLFTTSIQAGGDVCPGFNFAVWHSPPWDDNQV